MNGWAVYRTYVPINRALLVDSGQFPFESQANGYVAVRNGVTVSGRNRDELAKKVEAAASGPPAPLVFEHDLRQLDEAEPA